MERKITAIPSQLTSGLKHGGNCELTVHCCSILRQDIIAVTFESIGVVEVPTRLVFFYIYGEGLYMVNSEIYEYMCFLHLICTRFVV